MELKKLIARSPSGNPLEKLRSKSREVYSMEYYEAVTKNELWTHTDLEEYVGYVK